MIGKFIFARLGSYAGVTALIGSGDEARVYPEIAPQGVAYPYVAYEVFDGERYPCMGEDSGDDDGDIVRPRVRLHLWGEHSSVNSLATQVRLALHRFRGTEGGVAIDDVLVIPGGQDIWDESERVWHFVRDFDVIARDSNG